MKQLILILSLSLCVSAYAQDEKTVTLIVSGQGKTQEEAKQNALRSAIEQAFGTFISSKTEILNDNLVKDEIVSVSNGNIQKYEIISEVKVPDGAYATLLKATVSVSKLTSFVESKGFGVEFKGGLFAINIQNQELSSRNELICLNNLKETLGKISSNSFDYDINVFDPILNKTSNMLYNVPIKVTCKANKNLENWVLLFQKTLSQLAMPKEEIDNYLKLNKPSYIFKLFEKRPQELHFRNNESLKILNEIFAHLVFGIQNFEVHSNIEIFSLNKFNTRKRDWYTSNDQSEIQQRELNYLMLEFNYINLGRSGPNVFDGCYPCIYEKDFFYLMNRGPANFNVSMKNEISFDELSKLIGKDVAIYEFNHVLNLDELRKLSKYEVKQKR